jgi:ATP-grasp domain
MAPKVLLTDSSVWPGAARLAIELSKVGCDVSALCPIPGHPLRKVRGVRKTFSYSSLRPVDALMAAIEATEPQIVIPCDDRAVEHLHELHTYARRPGITGGRIAPLVERSLGSPESYPIVSSRYDLLSLAREEGIPVPDTKRVDTLDDLRAWHAEKSAPSVLKADGTWGGNGVKIAQTPEEAEQFFLELTRPFNLPGVMKRLIMNRDRFWLRSWWRHLKPPLIVQSYVRGRPANCAVVCFEGRVLAGICVEVVSAQRLKGPATVVRTVQNPQMILSAERIAGRLGLSGFFGLDFMIEDGSDTAYLIEMNPRCTQLCHLRLGKGRDMIGALYAQLTGEPLRETPPVTHNDMIAYFPAAWNCWSEFVRSSFQDIPLGELELIKELLGPSSDRSILGRMYDQRRRLPIGENRLKGHVFTTAGARAKFSGLGQNLESAPTNPDSGSSR